MSCGLSDDEIDVLYFLYHKRSVRSDRTTNSKLLKKIFDRRHIAVADVLKKLSNEGYITKIPKGDPKYYISNLSKTIRTLNLHGKETNLGKIVQ